MTPSLEKLDYQWCNIKMLDGVYRTDTETLYQLGVATSFSRPRVSNDNAYSESIFKTCKYRPDYPYKGFLNID